MACCSAILASRRLERASIGAVTPSAIASSNTSAGLSSPVAFCAANSPPAPPPICKASSLPHAAIVAFLAAVPASLPSAIRACAGFKNLPAMPIDRASNVPIIRPRLAPFSLISSMILGLDKALDIAFASSMLTPLSCKTSAMTEPYSIPPELRPAAVERATTPAGPSTKEGTIPGKDTAKDSTNIVNVARGLEARAEIASP